MPDITLTIPADKVDLIKQTFDYKETVKDQDGNDIPNPVSALDHVETSIINLIKFRVQRYEQQQVINNATYTDINVT
jgi:hypothetical protein